ncbi:MAG TPA: FecR family protein [Candidatus Udaeobacter sp.]|nr:FecR family protein [Candidatus Udaeobacter sp.]
MKKSFVRTFSRKFIVLFWPVCAASLVTAAEPEQARVSQVIQDVRLLEPHGAPRPAAVNDTVTQRMGVRTGTESRAELTFTDLTLTRLGANTIFSFKQGARELDLTSGAVLLEVPPKAPAVKVNTSAVTAAVTGGTALLATGPPTKFMVLEGTGTFYPAGHPERAVTVHGGEMMMMTADGRMTKPEKFDVKLVVETSRLIQDFPPLENLPLIMAVVNLQLAEQQLPGSHSLARNLVDVISTTDQNANANPVILVSNSTSSPTVPPITPTPPPPPTPTPSPPTPTPSPSGTPTKFGTPSTIASPNPYVITSGTVITTDPSITTNGVTDQGKIYRGRSIDGPLSAWAFGSTSAFDTASGFDDLIGDGSGAAFKFTALQLNGDPTIQTANGEINLGLIAVNSITSGGAGGVLTFEGIRGLLLATQNGPITLGPEISFSGLHDLTIYARGFSSDLTLGSDISTTSQVRLFAERDMLMTSSITTDDLYAFVGRNISIDGEALIHAPTITLFAGQDLHWSGQISDETAFNSNGNVSISAAQMLDITNDLTIIRRNGGISSGLNVLLSAGTDLLVGGDLAIATDISNLTTGANIDVLANGDLTVGGSLALQTSATAQSGTGANIDLSVGGALTASDLFLGVEAGVQAPQQNGENVTLSVGQDLIAHNGANSGGVDLEIITPVQQTLNSGANLFLSVGNNLTTDVGGDTTLFINNNINNVVNGANILAAIGGNLNTNNLTLQLLNNGGEIGTGGIVDLAVSGNITAQGAAILDIENNGGIMDKNTAIAVAAGNINANSWLAQIDNRQGGVISGAGVIEMDVAGTANVSNDATIAFYGSDGAGSSAILVNGGNYNVGGTFLSYMDGNGAITFNNASAHADILKAGVFGANGVLNIGGGTLSADTMLKLYAPGSNGALNFISNVTLGGNSAKILAANSITIFDGVVVTIGGKSPADVYTNNANYTGFGGNGTTTGTFAGAGANRPLPLSKAPPFDTASPSSPTNGKRSRTVININNSGQLLSLLDGAVPGPNGRLRFPGHHRIHANADHLNVNRMIRADRDMADIRHMHDRGLINNRLGSGTRAF